MLSDAPGSDKEQWESVISPSGRGYYHQNVRRSMQECRTSKHTHKHVFVCINHEELSLTSVVYILQNIFFDYPVAYIFFHFYIFTLNMLFLYCSFLLMSLVILIPSESNMFFLHKFKSKLRIIFQGPWDTED